MAAGNGFINYSPDTAYGSTYSGYGGSTDCIDARKYTVPGSGALDINEIGMYCYRGAGSNYNMKMALFTHDSVNDCPESMISNSESAEIAINNTSNEKKSHTYTGTKPQVTGGDTVWIGWIADTSAAAINVNRQDSGGAGVFVNNIGSGGYPTWYSGADWHTHSDSTRDLSTFAVYDTPVSSAMPFFSDFRGGLNYDMTGGI